MAWDDLTALVNVATRDTFGVAVVYTPAPSGPSEALTGIFDAPGQLVAMSGSVPVQTTSPVLDIVAADLTVMPAQGDSLTVGGNAYEVAQVEPDGNGMIKLYLLEV